MTGAWHIARRDLRAAFGSPLAWLVLLAWTALDNLVFAFQLHDAFRGQGAGLPLSLGALHLGVFLLMLLAPAITMGAFAQERAQGTMQLLLTAPLSEAQLVAGKFLASWGILLALVAATLVQPLTLAFISQVHLPSLAAGYLGLALAAMLFAALGIWVSLVVDTAVAAYVLTFGAIAVLMLIGAGAGDSWYGRFAAAAGLGPRAAAFFQGEVRLGDTAWFLALSGGFLALSHATLQGRRIHG
jgi:ABC-2 type transport system permease protein